jgi:hypothetical protein
LCEVVNNSTETHKMLQIAYGDKVLSQAQTLQWFKYSKGGNKDVVHDTCSGQRTWYMTLAVDKGCSRQPLVVDNQKQHQTPNGWKKCTIHLKQSPQLQSEGWQKN